MKIAIKKVNKPLEIIEVQAKYRCELKPYIIENSSPTDMLEVVWFPDGVQMLVDECGSLKGLPHNIYITCKSQCYPIQTIPGTIVFAKFKPLPMFEEAYDYELIDITDKDIEYINKTLDNEVQAVLDKEFKKMYKGRNYGDYYVTEVQFNDE